MVLISNQICNICALPISLSSSVLLRSMKINSETTKPTVNVDIIGVCSKWSQTQSGWFSLKIERFIKVLFKSQFQQDYISSLLSSGIFDSAVICFCRATLRRKVALRAGSSKQGNTLLAKFGRKCVAAYHFFSPLAVSTYWCLNNASLVSLYIFPKNANCNSHWDPRFNGFSIWRTIRGFLGTLSNFINLIGDGSIGDEDSFSL